MSDRDASAASGEVAEGGLADPRVRSHDRAPLSPAGVGTEPRGAERSGLRLGPTALRVGLAVTVTWAALRWLRWSWPLLVAPPTDQVCRHLLALDRPRAVVESTGEETTAMAPQAPSAEGGGPRRPPAPRGQGEGAAITHDVCRASIERRLKRRGWVAAAALRHCLGNAKTLDDAATCR